MNPTNPEQVGAWRHGTPWPPPVAEAWARAHADSAGTTAGAPDRLRDGWWITRDPLGGTRLFSGDPVSGLPLRWAEADIGGTLHLVARWLDANPGEPSPLAWLRVRIPEGWAELEPGTARHGLWGVCDRVTALGASRAFAAAQPWHALHVIPALDRPADLPPGGGEAILNALASLAADQGAGRLTYRGPYPTAHLFEALLRSFRPEGGPTEARKDFIRDESSLAWTGELADHSLPWTPDPFACALATEHLLVRFRGGVSTVWAGTTPFRQAGPGGTPASGARLWRESDADGERVHAGLVLLGVPFRRVAVFDSRGTLLEDHRTPDMGTRASPPARGPLDPLWRAAIFAWCAHRAPEPLAAAVWSLRESLPVHWAPLPMSIAERGGGGVLVQSALSSQFRRLARKDPPAEVALKVFSDVVSAVSPILLDEARQLLLRLETPHRQRAWIEAGPEAKAQAQALLTGHAPKLIGAVAAGQLLGPEGVE